MEEKIIFDFAIFCQRSSSDKLGLRRDGFRGGRVVDNSPQKENIIKMKHRNKVERYLDRHNHFMELIRTLTGLTVLVLQVVILIKIFA